MQALLDFCKNEYFTLILLAINIVVIIVFIVNTVSLKKTKKTYKTLIKKLGKANNIEDMLSEYMKKTEEVSLDNQGIKNTCNNLEKELSKSLKKVGIIRYSAFKDMGSDLSFALAMLDQCNNGVVLNGIYSVENSNIYAKPVENGKSKYTLSEEEQKAISIAMQK